MENNNTYNLSGSEKQISYANLLIEKDREFMEKQLADSIKNKALYESGKTSLNLHNIELNIIKYTSYLEGLNDYVKNKEAKNIIETLKICPCFPDLIAKSE